MTRLEKIDRKIKRNYQIANIAWLVFIILGTVFETHMLVKFIKGTINYIQSL